MTFDEPVGAHHASLNAADVACAVRSSRLGVAEYAITSRAARAPADAFTLVANDSDGGRCRR